MNGVSTSIWMRHKWFQKIQERAGCEDYDTLTMMYLELVFNVKYLATDPITAAINEVIKREQRVDEILHYFEKHEIKSVWCPGKNFCDIYN